VGQGVVAEVDALAVLDLAGDDRAVEAAVGGDLLDGARPRRGGRCRRRNASSPSSLLAELVEDLAGAKDARRRRRGGCPPRPPRGTRAGRPRRGPSSPSSRPRWPRRR
jgi:hypothetical protein